MDSRRDFLTGAGAGVAAGVAGLKLADLGRNYLASPPHHFQPSFSQAGEDMIVQFIYSYLGQKMTSYMDIGAFDPTIHSNTYFFYLQGIRGLLVEPNVDLIPRLRQVRPEDKVLNAGIGTSNVASTEYYRLSVPARNTFSREEAEHTEKATGKQIFIKEVVQMPLVNVNDAIAEHLGHAPSFVSIDVEGMDLEILKSWDFKRFRPSVVCVETLVSCDVKERPEITEFMVGQGYVARGTSFVNSIFIDKKMMDSYRPAGP